MQLTKSGLSISLDEKESVLGLNDTLCQGHSQKTTEQMKHVLAYPESASNDVAFAFYKGLTDVSDSNIFEKSGLRYDITVVFPGLVGRERKKTTGHIHAYLEAKRYAHAELYEVISGTAMFILQPVSSNRAEPEKIITVVAEAGEKILIPENFMHCTTNFGIGTLVFSNLVLDFGTNEYDCVAKRGGMGVFVCQNGEKLQIIRNQNYSRDIQILSGNPIQSEKLRTIRDQPMYLDFVMHPEAYEFLREPSGFLGEMKDSITYKKCDISLE
jgi:glucose-6-phosphate isomerase